MTSTEIKSSLVAKQRVLTENETESSFTTWQQGIMFQLVVDSKFSRFTDPDDLGTWKSTSVQNRGYTNDATTGEGAVPADIRMTGVQKAKILKVLLGSVATFAPTISNKYITEQSTCFDDIFNRLRSHYGFRITGGRILEIAQYSLLPNESYETLWERLSAFIEDNLMKVANGIQHNGIVVQNDEILSPTLQNLSVVLWLKAINPDLPAVVKQKFATQLKDNTLHSLRDDISESLSSLLADIHDREGSVSYTKSHNPQKPSRKYNNRPSNPHKSPQPYPQKKKLCCLCESAGRHNANTHYLSECKYLPLRDKKYLSQIRDVTADNEEYSEDDDDDDDEYQTSTEYTPHHKSPYYTSSVQCPQSLPTSSRVDVIPSPILEVYINDQNAELMMDSGAEVNLIEERECLRLQLKIKPTAQKASMADGASPLKVIGEVKFMCYKDHHALKFSGLVVKNLNCPILAGMPFLVINDVFIRPKENSIYLGDCCKFKNKSKYVSGSVGSCKATILKVPQKVCLLPGDELIVNIPENFKNKEIAIEPRVISQCNSDNTEWLSCHTTITGDNGEIKVTNSSTNPVLLKKNEQFAQIRQVESNSSNQNYEPPPVKKPSLQYGPFSKSIDIDPGNTITNEHKATFNQIHQQFDNVFSPDLGKYNGASGPFSHVITMGPSLPPQRPGRNPQYNRSNKELLQKTIDELYTQGVFAKPEDINVNVEYVSPSFLIKKPNGGHRLVTAFGEIAEHARPQPAAMTNVDEVLRQIAQWKYIVKTDLKQAYYQIPLSKDSMKYAGIVSPYRGTFVYQRAVMGLPGSEASLECLLSRILGDLMLKGNVVKLADDLYIGADTVDKLLETWKQVLSLLQENGMKLSPTKTICCPKSTVVLGWLWENGTIRSTPHRLNTLMQCEPPETVHKLRSFIGSYKALSKVLQYSAYYIGPLEILCASNKAGNEKIVWTDDLLAKFRDAKSHLNTAKVVTLPRKNDALQIVTDASAKGIAATLYSIRNGKPVLSGLFNAKIKPHHSRWLPCELEALAITSSIKYFSPFIIQSSQKTKILSDSLPCVNAYKKLMRGEFSASPRVTTYLSTLSHYQVELQHVSGKNNTLSDFASRNPITCDGSCQICTFIEEADSSVVNNITYSDIITGRNSIPYTSRGAWLSIQQGCNDLSKLSKMLKSGRALKRNDKNQKDLKRYYNKVKLSTSPADGLLIVEENKPLQPTRQRIVVPRHVVDGLLTALHLKLSHPSKEQLKLAFNRGFFALDTERLAEHVVKGCHTCASLKKIPTHFTQQTTSPAPDHIGARFSSDIIKREKQLILLVRETITSYSDLVFIKSEKSEDVAEGIVKIITKLRSNSSPNINIRVDPGTAFQSLQNNKLLASLNIVLEIGDAKNINKNPIGERGISEVLEEIAKLQPNGGPISEIILAVATSNLNSKIRRNGFSSIELWTRRDMTSGKPINIDDDQFINQKQEERIKNHKYSAKYKARGQIMPTPIDVKCGDIVYLYQDRIKGQCRDKYIVTEIEHPYAFVQKLCNNQLRAKKYRVQHTDIIKVKPENTLPQDNHGPDDSGDENSLITINLRSQVENSDATSELDNTTHEIAQGKNLCTQCKTQVFDHEDGLLCDECEEWCHRGCCNMSKKVYNELSNSDEKWSCPVHTMKRGRPPGFIRSETQ